MFAGSLLDGGNSFAHFAIDFKKSERDDRIGEVCQVDGRRHLAEKSVWRQNQDRDHSLLIQKGKQLVQLEVKRPLFSHRVEVAVQAVHVDHPDAVLLYRRLDFERQLTRRQIGRIDLRYPDGAVFDVRLEVEV